MSSHTQPCLGLGWNCWVFSPLGAVLVPVGESSPKDPVLLHPLSYPLRFFGGDDSDGLVLQVLPPLFCLRLLVEMYLLLGDLVPFKLFVRLLL